MGSIDQKREMIGILPLAAVVTLTLLCTWVTLAQAQYGTQESIVVMRVNSEPCEHLLHFHGIPPEPGAQVGVDASPFRNGRHLVHMHTNSPVADIEVKEGDELTLVHSSYPNDVLHAKIPRLGEWFAVNFPAGSNLRDAGVTLRLMLVSYGATGKQQLVTTDGDEYVEANNSKNLGPFLPNDLKHTIRGVPIHDRAAIYKQHLKEKYPQLPELQDKEL